MRMLVAFLGYLLLGLGPGAVLFLSIPARRPFLVILTFASACTWLLSLLFVAMLTRAFLPLPTGSPWFVATLALAVAVQEALRVGVWFAYRNGSKQLEVLARRMACAELNYSDHMSMAYAIGLGHGLAHSMFFFLGVATLTLSPATFYVAACPQMNVFLYSAMTSCAFVVLHTFSMVIAFDGYAHRSVLRIALPPVIHLVAALATAMSLKDGGCMYVVPVEALLALATMAFACTHVFRTYSRVHGTVRFRVGSYN